MNSALAVPTVGDIATRWTVQPLALAAAAVAVGWYAWSLRRLIRSEGRAQWPRRRTVTFALGIALLVWSTCGVAEVYARSLYWVWTSQQLLLLLIVPVLLMAGQPIDLARRIARRAARCRSGSSSRPSDASSRTRSSVR